MSLPAASASTGNDFGMNDGLNFERAVADRVDRLNTIVDSWESSITGIAKVILTEYAAARSRLSLTKVSSGVWVLQSM